MTPDERIAGALDIAVRYGGIDGAHHKDWVIDQMVRHLTGCPTVTLQSRYKNAQGEDYTYEGLGESDEYRALIAAAKAGEDGREAYWWEEGIAP